MTFLLTRTLFTADGLGRLAVFVSFFTVAGSCCFFPWKEED